MVKSDSRSVWLDNHIQSCSHVRYRHRCVYKALLTSYDLWDVEFHPFSFTPELGIEPGFLYLTLQVLLSVSIFPISSFVFSKQTWTDCGWKSNLCDAWIQSVFSPDAASEEMEPVEVHSVPSCFECLFGAGALWGGYRTFKRHSRW